MEGAFRWQQPPPRVPRGAHERGTSALGAAFKSTEDSFSWRVFRYELFCLAVMSSYLYDKTVRPLDGSRRLRKSVPTIDIRDDH